MDSERTQVSSAELTQMEGTEINLVFSPGKSSHVLNKAWLDDTKSLLYYWFLPAPVPALETRHTSP